MMASHDLTGLRIVIGGGTGDVGNEIIERLLAAGAEVLAVIRSAGRAEALGTHERLTLIEGFPDDDASVAAVRQELQKLGPIHGAVASLGPWFHGPALSELPKLEWDHMVSAALTSHYLFARSLMPALAAASGQYIMINGAGALAPVPHSGVVSILAHAQMMMGEVLAAEHEAVSVHTLMLRSIIATRARRTADPTWVTAAEVGDACAWLFTPQGRMTAGSTVTLNQKSVTEGYLR
jgi:NAD(P)-dependent dehydrogenase (short-subunit alcohol dehydrogenase family)